MMNNPFGLCLASRSEREKNNPLPKYPTETGAKELLLMKNYQRLQDLEEEIKYFDKGPYLVGMSSEGAFSFFFPDSGHLGNQAENKAKAKYVDPVFDPEQPKLSQPKFSFAEYFRGKAQPELEEEERKAMEEEEKAAWKRMNDLRNNGKEYIPPAFDDGVSKNYRIVLEKLGMTGTKMTVHSFDYLPLSPEDDPNIRRISVLSTQLIEHENLKYQGVNDKGFK